jgi:anti-sigma factor RsiW
MSCREIEAELVAYHFGEVDEETRRRLEEHLVGCPACLGAFLAIKRDIETAESAPRPSEAARRRLREDVAREIAPPARGIRRWSWWERPLAFGFAGAAVLVALLAVGQLFTGPGARPHGLLEADPPALFAPPRQ